MAVLHTSPLPRSQIVIYTCCCYGEFLLCNLCTCISTEVNSSYTSKQKKAKNKWINKRLDLLKNIRVHSLGLQHNHVAQYAPWKESRSRNVSKMEAAALFCASVIFRRPKSSSLSLACEAASAASFAMPIRAYVYTKVITRLLYVLKVIFLIF